MMTKHHISSKAIRKELEETYEKNRNNSSYGEYLIPTEILNNINSLNLGKKFEEYKC